jgi:DNA polymerase-1
MDIHTATAARVYGIEEDAVDAEMRRRAKMVNFGIIYGISAHGLAQRLGIPRAEAGKIIDAYFERYSGVKSFMDRTIGEARKSGYVETISGRRRMIRDINSANGSVRGGAERVAINTPIQGTAADMIKIAMIRVARDIEAAGLRSRLLLQVHDELIFDMADDEADRLRPLVKTAMVQALPLDGVPVVVEMGSGHTWLEAH